MSEYSELFLDPRWQKLRLKVLERDEWTCQNCGDKDSTLHVHHRYYLPDRRPWEYTLDVFVTLCKDCHEYETVNRPLFEKSLLNNLKMKFLGTSLVDFINILPAMPMQYNEKVIAAAYSWAMQDHKMQNEIVKKFHQYLEKKNKKTNKNGMA